MKIRLKYIFLNTLIITAMFTLCSCFSLPVSDVVEEPPEKGSDNIEANDNSIKCYLLIIDQIEVTYLSNESDIDKILQRLILESEFFEFSDVKLTNDVVVTDAFCDPCMVSNVDEALKSIKDSEITLTYGFTENLTITVAVEYQTVYENSSLYFEGETAVKTQGKAGEKEQIFKITYADGVEIDRKLLSESVTKSPVNKVVLVGTKKSTASSGSYTWPIKGTIYITSYFGARTLNGVYDYHYGIDLRAATGTSIYAADGGKVIYAGVMGSYGNLVKIEHDNGDVTYYGHLSSISVKVGNRVYKGQLIAKSGATGNVTGPHLHFEIRKNGKLTDPLLSLPSY